MNEDYYAGKGCKCFAYSSSECCCNVDWTDPEIYILRAKVAELEEWKCVVDEALVISHLGTADSCGTPKEALNKLLVWSEGVGAHFAI